MKTARSIWGSIALIVVLMMSLAVPMVAFAADDTTTGIEAISADLEADVDYETDRAAEMGIDRSDLVRQDVEDEAAKIEKDAKKDYSNAKKNVSNYAKNAEKDLDRFSKRHKFDLDWWWLLALVPLAALAWFLLRRKPVTDATVIAEVIPVEVEEVPSVKTTCDTDDAATFSTTDDDIA
jgi:hypothetical protein